MLAIAASCSTCSSVHMKCQILDRNIYYLRFLRRLYSHYLYHYRLYPLLLLLHVAYSTWPRKTSSCIHDVGIRASYNIWTRRLYYTMTMARSYAIGAYSLSIQLRTISHLETKTKLYYYLLFILCYNIYSYSIMARVCILHVLCAIIIIYTIIITLRNNFRKKVRYRGTYVCYRIKSLYECYYRHI